MLAVIDCRSSNASITCARARHQCREHADHLECGDDVVVMGHAELLFESPVARFARDDDQPCGVGPPALTLDLIFMVASLFGDGSDG
jgi:hypothetical protein